jgi:hypothetical protein
VYLHYWVSGICPSSSFVNRTQLCHVIEINSFWQMQLRRCLPMFSPRNRNRWNFWKLCNSKHFPHIEYKHNLKNVSFALVYSAWLLFFFFLLLFRFHLKRMRRWQRTNQMVRLIDVQCCRYADMRRQRSEVNNNGHPEEGNSNAASQVV